MKKILYILFTIHCSLFTLLLLSACTETVSDAKQESALPQIYPDYLGVTIPVNIAPLNFNMADEKAVCIDAVITDGIIRVKNRWILIWMTGISCLLRILETRSA